MEKTKIKITPGGTVHFWNEGSAVYVQIPTQQPEPTKLSSKALVVYANLMRHFFDRETWERLFSRTGRLYGGKPLDPEEADFLEGES